MEEINKTGVKSLDELRSTRLALRMAVVEKEQEIIGHFKPVTKLIGFFDKKPKVESFINDQPNSLLKSVAKIAIPLFIGRRVIRHKKKFLLLPLLGYMLKQAAEYVLSKPVREHVEDFKERFGKKHESTGEAY